MIALSISGIAFAAFAFSSVAAYAPFDRIVRRLHDTARDTWFRIGAPYGFFWWPRDGSWAYGLTEKWRVFLDLQGEAPDWISDDAELLKTHRTFFILTRAMWVSLLCAMASAIIAALLLT